MRRSPEWVFYFSCFCNPLACVFEPGWHTLKCSYLKRRSQTEDSSAPVRMDSVRRSLEKKKSSARCHHVSPKSLQLILPMASSLLCCVVTSADISVQELFHSTPRQFALSSIILQKWSCSYGSATRSDSRELCLKAFSMQLGGVGGVEAGGCYHVLQALKSLSYSDPWVTNRAGSCLVSSSFFLPVFFQMLMPSECWKPQIGPFRSSVWCLVRPPLMLESVVFLLAALHPLPASSRTFCVLR